MLESQIRPLSSSSVAVRSGRNVNASRTLRSSQIQHSMRADACSVAVTSIATEHRSMSITNNVPRLGRALSICTVISYELQTPLIAQRARDDLNPAFPTVPATLRGYKPVQLIGVPASSVSTDLGRSTDDTELHLLPPGKEDRVLPRRSTLQVERPSSPCADSGHGHRQPSASNAIRPSEPHSLGRRSDQFFYQVRELVSRRGGAQ